MARDRALGGRALLRLSDFPAGWTAEPRDKETNGQPQLQESVANCLHVDVALLRASKPAKVDSPDFKDSNGTTISNSVTLQPSVGEAKEYAALFERPQTAPCLSKAMATAIDYSIRHPAKPTDEIPSDLKIGTATVAQMSFPPAGDESVAYRVTVPASYKGLDVKVYVDFVLLRSGRATAGLSFEDTGSPVDTEKEEQLTALTANRLRKEGGGSRHSRLTTGGAYYGPDCGQPGLAANGYSMCQPASGEKCPAGFSPSTSATGIDICLNRQH